MTEMLAEKTNHNNNKLSQLDVALATKLEPFLPHNLSYTDEVKRATDALYPKVAHHIPEIEWPSVAPLVYAINEVKKIRNAVILAHNYMTPDIYYCVSDHTGDSLQLAIDAANSDADVIVQAGVHFMAETSKILSPEKTVLIPDAKAGCSLASSITGEEVRKLKAQYPGVPVVTYVNTTADVKAESDICCTSANALKIVEGLGVDRVICLPDGHLANNVANETDVEVITYEGYCEVHDLFDAESLKDIRKSDPDVKIIAHPECPPEVIGEADFSGSTKGMIDFVMNEQPEKVVMLTECSMSDNVASNVEGVEFVKPCNICPHMKRINLENILNSLLYLDGEVYVDPELSKQAKGAIDRMIAAS